MGRDDKKTWKADYFTRIGVRIGFSLFGGVGSELCIFQTLFEKYPKCFLVGVDNVGSKQMQEIRQTMRSNRVAFLSSFSLDALAIFQITARSSWARTL